MKILFYLFLLLTCSLTACDDKKVGPWEAYTITQFIWVNKSDHQITINLASYWNESAVKTDILEPGDSFCDWADDFTPFHFGTFLRNGITIVFDEGPYGGAYNAYWERDDPQPSLRDETLYEHEEYEGEYGIFYSIWTYTFTNADYDAAVARGPMESE